MKNSSTVDKNNEIFSDAINITWDLLRNENFLINTSDDERVSRKSAYLGVEIYEAIKKIREKFMSESVDDKKVSLTLQKQQSNAVIKISDIESDCMSNDFVYSNNEDEEDEEAHEYSEIDSDNSKKHINNYNNQHHKNDNKKLNNKFNDKNYSNNFTERGIQINVIDDDSSVSSSSSSTLYSVKNDKGPSIQSLESRSTDATKKSKPEEDNAWGCNSNSRSSSRQYQTSVDSRENLISETTAANKSMPILPSQPSQPSPKLLEIENEWETDNLYDNNVAQETKELYKKLCCILNKLTSDNIDKMVDQIADLEIDSTERLQGVVDLIFQKANDDSNFAKTYAIMCEKLVDMQNDLVDNETEQEDKYTTNFKSLIISRCQYELENNILERVSYDKELEEIKKSDDIDIETKKALRESIKDTDRQSRIKSIGKITFIGELYNQKLLEDVVICTYMEHLLTTPDEVRLEYLCKLLTTIGKKFENKSVLQTYFSKMTELTKLGDEKISKRIRFMLQDVIDLRSRNWKPRINNEKINNQVRKDNISTMSTSKKKKQKT